MSIPALTYHKVESRIELGLNVIHPARFHLHLSALTNAGYQFCTAKSQKQSPSIIITFDDAYEVVFDEALPILMEFEAPAVTFVITDYIGKTNDWDIHFGVNRSRHINRNQIMELHNAGWEIASHGCDHQSFTQLSAVELKRQLTESKKILEDIIGAEVISLTAPFNAMVPIIWDLAGECGYKFIFGQQTLGSCPVPSQPVEYIPRRMVYGIDKSKHVLKKAMGSHGFELVKENIIHFCSNATIAVKELL